MTVSKTTATYQLVQASFDHLPSEKLLNQRSQILVKKGVSDEDCLVLWENYESKNPDFSRDSYDPFTLKNMRDAAEFKAEFRVENK